MESKQENSVDQSAGWGAKKAEVKPEDYDDAHRKNVLNSMSWALQNNMSLHKPGAPLS